MITSVKDELTLLIRARYPVIYLLTFEEERAEKLLSDLAASMKKKLETWSVTDEGTHGKTGEQKALAALDEAMASKESSIIVFRDFDAWLDLAPVRRKLRDLVADFARAHKTLVLLSPTLKIPSELEKDITIVDLPLPNREEIGETLEEALGFASRNAKLSVSLTEEEKSAVIDASLGLTIAEAKRIYAKAMLTDHSFDARDIDLILFEKKQLIRKSGSLEYFDASENMADVGGMESLKEWLEGRKRSFTIKAREYGLPLPKGVMMLGVQGCGKSLTSKGVAALFGQPLLRLDMGKIFSSFIGSSEENMRKAIKTAESLAPVVLWIDEIEKGLSGIQSSGSTDAGVTARIFGTFLTWMQEKTAPVFIVATANDISQLPPELLRKGRFDEIFFIDLPQQTERESIFAIHLAKRNRRPEDFDLTTLAEEANGYSGAEIEMAVVEGLYKAFAHDREIEDRDIIKAIHATVPLSTTMAERIAHLRQWANDRARPASR